jgi:hypothetical protein
MRKGMRRFTRLTDAFSKKVENHAYQVALHFMHYNFCRIHKSLRLRQRWKRESLTTCGRWENCWKPRKFGFLHPGLSGTILARLEEQ